MKIMYVFSKEFYVQENLNNCIYIRKLVETEVLSNNRASELIFGINKFEIGFNIGLAVLIRMTDFGVQVYLNRFSLIVFNFLVFLSFFQG